MRGSLLALIVVATAWGVPPGGDAPKHEPPPRGDRYGDPLPDGAVGRLGTVRFGPGTGCYAIALSTDGKRVLVADHDRSITVFDAATGRRLPKIGARGDNNSYPSPSRPTPRCLRSVTTTGRSTCGTWARAA